MGPDWELTVQASVSRDVVVVQDLHHWSGSLVPQLKSALSNHFLCPQKTSLVAVHRVCPGK